mmetsp:Transcript_28240/g.76003  ORF Transcript_28240/g.76003 Transcript_28240/m.76003 type:complete len:221 (+) Transcript_28240:1074-1736(+)
MRRSCLYGSRRTSTSGAQAGAHAPGWPTVPSSQRSCSFSLCPPCRTAMHARAPALSLESMPRAGRTLVAEGKSGSATCAPCHPTHRSPTTRHVSRALLSALPSQRSKARRPSTWCSAWPAMTLLTSGLASSGMPIRVRGHGAAVGHQTSHPRLWLPTTRRWARVLRGTTQRPQPTDGRPLWAASVVSSSRMALKRRTAPATLHLSVSVYYCEQTDESDDS